MNKEPINKQETSKSITGFYGTLTLGKPRTNNAPYVVPSNTRNIEKSPKIIVCHWDINWNTNIGNFGHEGI